MDIKNPMISMVMNMLMSRLKELNIDGEQIMRSAREFAEAAQKTEQNIAAMRQEQLVLNANVSTLLRAMELPVVPMKGSSHDGLVIDHD